MIEQGHLEALRLASTNAERAAQNGDFEQIRISARQMEAVALLEVERKKILAELNVPDIEKIDFPTADLDYAPILRADLQNKLNVEIPLVLADSSFGQTLAYLRKKQRSKEVNLAITMHASQSTISALENDRWKGGRQPKSSWSFTTLISGLGWDSEDDRAKILAKKFITQFPNLVSEVEQFFLDPTEETKS